MNQNFYVIERDENEVENNKNSSQTLQGQNGSNAGSNSYEWNKNYGIKNKDGVIQKDIQW